MRCTLMPVPRMQGLPSRISGEEVNNVPTSMLIVVGLPYELNITAVGCGFDNRAALTPEVHPHLVNFIIGKPAAPSS